MPFGTLALATPGGDDRSEAVRIVTAGLADKPWEAVMPDAYADADPEEGVTVTGVGPMTLRRAVRKYVDWREHHGLPLVVVYREAGKQPSMFDMGDLSRLAEMERFR